MKQALFLLLLVATTIPETRAQQYHCVQPGVKRFFINGHHYLRGMRIDSTVTIGNNTVFYPFRTPRRPTYYTDSLGGSWMGKRIIQQPDGITHFENRLGDSIIIKTAATTGAQWNFYSDTTATHYTASVTATDTMTVLGQVDSVKTIAIQAMHGNTVLANDPVNKYIIRLSKNHGFVQAFDFFTFPYHDTGYSAIALQDYFLLLNHYTDTSYAAFRLIEYHNPLAADIYDFAPGDMLISSGMYYPGTTAVYSVSSARLDSIISRQVTGPNIIYTSRVRTSVLTDYWSPGAPYNTVYQSGISQLVIPIGTLAIMDSLKMPEEGNNSFIYYYDPADTTHCITGAYYKRQQYFIPHPLEGPSPEEEAWKAGLGIIDSVNSEGNSSIPSYYTGSLIFSRKNFMNCGAYDPVMPLSVAGVSSLKGVTVFPNPVTDMLTISSDAASPVQMQLSLSDINGSVVRRCSFVGGINMNLSVKELPAGLYFLHVLGGGESWVRKVFVAHGD